METRKLTIPSAEPFFFPAGPVACLLVHGFTGTPKEMLPLGQFLSKLGYTALGIRLAGHATTPNDMRRCSWMDWLASVEDGFNLLNSYSKIWVIGLSMGGALSLLAASRLPATGVISLSTPHRLPADWRIKFLPILSVFAPNVAKGAPDWQNPSAADEHRSYPKYPTRSILELNRLLEKMRQNLAEVSCPALFIQSHKDQTVPPESMPFLYDSVASVQKQKIWLENSGHVITRDQEQEKVFQLVSDFMSQNTPTP